MGFVSKDTIDALEIAHTQGAESRLRVVAESIQADLAIRTASIDRIGDDVKGLDSRTSKIEESGFEKAIDARLSNIEEQMRQLPQHRGEHPDESYAQRKIATLETQITSIKNELEGTKGTTSYVKEFETEMTQIKTIIRQLPGEHSQVVEALQNTLHNALQGIGKRTARESVDFLCGKLKKYDPSRSQADALENLISAVLSNPALSTRLQSNEPGQQRSQSQSTKNRKSSKPAIVAIEGGEPERRSTETDQAKVNSRKVDARTDLDDLTTSSTYSAMPSPTRKALMKQRRSMIVHDSASEDEITVKRPKTKSYTRT